MDKLQFRPHHFLCTLCFQGKGYSPSFIKNYKKISHALTDETDIEVVSHTDSICAPCPHKRDLKCTSQEKIEKLDSAHQDILKLPKNITWKKAKQLIYENMTLEKFHQACAPCDWKTYGLCEKVLTSFLQTEHSNA